MTPQTDWVRDVDAVRKELDGASDRAAITIGGGLVELALEQALLSVLRAPKNKDEASRLFNGGGIIETFSQKIWACYFLKVISPTARKDLDTIRKIRNIAAHHVNPISFDDQQITDLCANLPRAAKPAKATNRKQFVTTVLIYTGLLIAYSVLPEKAEIGGDETVNGVGLGTDADAVP